MKACQIVIALLWVAALLIGVHKDIHGVKARPPNGFSGVVISLVVSALMAYVYWKAGAFSELF